MRKLLCCFLIVVFLAGCGGHLADHTINVYHESYYPGLDASRHAALKGKMFSFYSIEIEAENVTNFTFYSPNHKIGYALYYTRDKLRQPVASYFWYTLAKSFRHAGLFVMEQGPMNSVPILVLTFTSITDSEAVFRIKMTKDNVFLFEKKIIVTQILPVTEDYAELERRSYQFLDLMADHILSDEDFIKAFDPETVPKILEAQAQLRQIQEKQRRQMSSVRTPAYQAPPIPVTPGIMKLPDGEEILDLSGTWDLEFVNYGTGSHGFAGLLLPAEVMIKQNERIFEIIMKRDSSYANRGTLMMRGKILQGDFRITDAVRTNWMKMKCQVDESRNKIICDDGSSQRLTYTRR